MKTNKHNAGKACTVSLVFAKEKKGDIRKEIAEMLLHAWLERMDASNTGVEKVKQKADI